MTIKSTRKLACGVLLSGLTSIAAATLSTPAASAATFYVTSFSKNTLSTFDSTASSPTLAPVTTSGVALVGPHGLAFDSAGILWEANFGTAIGTAPTNKINKINTATGVITNLLLDSNGASIINPSGITFDRSGTLWVTDYNKSNQLFKVNTGTGAVTTFNFATGSTIANPSGLAFDKNGILYVASHTGNSISKVDVTSGIVTSFVISNVASVPLVRPDGLVFDDNGVLWETNYGPDSGTTPNPINKITIDPTLGTGTISNFPLTSSTNSVQVAGIATKRLPEPLTFIGTIVGGVTVFGLRKKMGARAKQPQD